MRYLVTGGAGFLGSSLVRSLTGDGHEVRVLDDLSRGNQSRIMNTGCMVIPADVRDEQLTAYAMNGCDAVVHMAYLQGTQTFYAEPRQVLDVALRGILSVLNACAVTGCPDLLLVSSSEAYQVAPVVPTPEDVPLTVPDVLNPRYSYGGGKIASELAALAWQRAGVLDRVVIARAHNVYGPDMGREHVIPEFCLRMNDLIATRPDLETLPFPIQGSGQETRSFCWIGDCIAQLRLLMDRRVPDGVYNVGQMNEITIAAVAREVAAAYDRDIKIEPGKLPQGSPPRRLPDTGKIMTAARDLMADHGGDFPLPRPVSFAEGVLATARWYRDHG